MKYACILSLLILISCKEPKPHNVFSHSYISGKSGLFMKVHFDGHSYIVYQNYIHKSDHFIHDPDCICGVK